MTESEFPLVSRGRIAAHLGSQHAVEYVPEGGRTVETVGLIAQLVLD